MMKVLNYKDSHHSVVVVVGIVVQNLEVLKLVAVDDDEVEVVTGEADDD